MVASNASTSSCHYGFVVREAGMAGPGHPLDTARNSTQDQKELCDGYAQPGLGSEHNSSSSYQDLNIGDGFARASQLGERASRTPGRTI